MCSFDSQVRQKEFAIGFCLEPTILPRKSNTKGYDIQVCLFMDSLHGLVVIQPEFAGSPSVTVLASEGDSWR